MKRLQNFGNSYGSSLPTTGLMEYRTPVDPTRLFEGTPVKVADLNDECEDDEAETGGAVFYNIIDHDPVNDES